MAEYQRAIQEEPANAAEAHYRIGVLSNKLGNTEGAVQEFRVALQLNPNHAEARAAVSAFQVNCRATAWQQHRLDEALRELQEAVNADTKNLTAQLHLGQGYNAQQQYEPALAAFRAVLEGNPDKAEAYAGLRVASFHQGQHDEANKAFDTAIRLHLVAGRRDLAQQVKDEANVLMPPAPVAKPAAPRPAAHK
jgi:tetratricopeptide (TPR) repeat protein